jgi:hypothetical protein
MQDIAKSNSPRNPAALLVRRFDRATATARMLLAHGAGCRHQNIELRRHLDRACRLADRLGLGLGVILERLTGVELQLPPGIPSALAVFFQPIEWQRMTVRVCGILADAPAVRMIAPVARWPRPCVSDVRAWRLFEPQEARGPPRAKRPRPQFQLRALPMQKQNLSVGRPHPKPTVSTTQPLAGGMPRDRTLRCDSGGKVLYVPIARWRDRELTRRFSNGVVTLVRRRDPRAFPATADGDAA